MDNFKDWLHRLLKITILEGASDLHIVAGYFPTIRVEGNLMPLKKEKQLTPEDTEGLVLSMMDPNQKEDFLKKREIDFSFDFEENVRFRVNAFFQRNKVSAALRVIPAKIRTIEELNLPPILHLFTSSSQGFVLITGPSSHGKSTTLAALIEEINQTRTEHIITIEDPIEYTFVPQKSVIEQREVGIDTHSFTNALKSVLRQDPDVIMIGEMRDPESMAMALTAAETGHLVFSTLHTNSAAQTIHRIVDSFPPEQQPQIRAQFSGALLGIVSQRLLPRIRGGLIPACEVLINTPAISNLIRENKIHEIPLVIETSTDVGMIPLNRYLVNLVKKNEITIENAFQYSSNPSEIKHLLK